MFVQNVSSILIIDWCPQPTGSPWGI